jgi:hypothetical protein
MPTKRITELQLRSDFDATCLIPVDDSTQSFRCSGQQVYDFIKSFGMLDTWSASITYAAEAYVVYSGFLYRSRQGTNLNQTPSATSAYWQRLGVEPTIDAASGTAGVTLSGTDEEVQCFTPSAGITVKLDNTFRAGQKVTIVNEGTAEINLTANDDSVIATVYRKTSYQCMAKSAAAAATASWLGLTFIASPWIPFTASGSWSTNTTYTAAYMREGQMMNVSVALTFAGAPTSTTLTLNVPLSKTIHQDTDSMIITSTGRMTPLGIAQFKDATDTTWYKSGLVLHNSTSSVGISHEDDGAGAVENRFISQAIPFTWASGDELTAVYRIPIVGWSANKG